MNETTQGRLAAIVAADVAGFSRLIGADEEGTGYVRPPKEEQNLVPDYYERAGKGKG